MVSLWAPTTPSGSRASSRYHEDAYEKEYELTIEEKNNFNFYLKVSAIRFFLTRIYDLNFNVEGNVKHKNPLEFFEIFKFHEKNNLQDFF